MRDCGCQVAYKQIPDNTDYLGKPVGNPVVKWPGWVDNDARYSVQTDINPMPIVPVHFQNWPDMQYQLSNGWQFTNYGQRMPYDDYLRLLYSSMSTPGAPAPMPGEGLQPQQKSMASQKQIQNAIVAAQGSPASPGGTGIIAPGVNLSNRRFYG